MISIQLYFIWVTGSQKQYEWLLDIIKQVESADQHNVAETHCFITQFFQKFDLRTTMLASEKFLIQFVCRNACNNKEVHL